MNQFFEETFSPKNTPVETDHSAKKTNKPLVIFQNSSSTVCIYW